MASVILPKKAILLSSSRFDARDPSADGRSDNQSRRRADVGNMRKVIEEAGDMLSEIEPEINNMSLPSVNLRE